MSATGRSLSAGQVRELMQSIPSWEKFVPKLGDETLFQESGADSLALFELVAELQRVTGLEFPDDDIERISSIAGVVQYLRDEAG